MATKNEETRALTLAQQYPMLAGAEGVAEAVELNLGGEELSPFDLERIKVPAGGARQWDLGDTAVNEIEGIILYQKLIRSYWAEKLGDNGGGSPPDCASSDGLTGEGDPGGSCAACPFSKFGSAENGRAQACKQMRVVFIARPGDLLPTMLIVPPSSLKPFKKYMLALTSRGIPYMGVKTGFGLTKVENKSGIAYSEITLRVIEPLSPDDMREVRSKLEMLRPLFQQDVTIDRGEIEFEEPEGDLATRTGHVPWTPTECVEHDAAYTPEGVLVCRRCKKVLEEPEPAQAGLV